MTLYLSSAISASQSDDWRSAFSDAASLLRGRGHRVHNPVEADDKTATVTWSGFMRRDITNLLSARAVVLVPPWRGRQYVGVNVAIVVAAALGLTIHEIDPSASRGYGPDLLPNGLTDRERAALVLSGHLLDP